MINLKSAIAKAIGFTSSAVHPCAGVVTGGISTSGVGLRETPRILAKGIAQTAVDGSGLRPLGTLKALSQSRRC